MPLMNRIQDEFKNLTPKQKITGVVTVIMIAIVIWQVIELIPSSPKATPVATAATPVATPAPGTAAPAPTTQPTTAAAPQPVAPTPIPEPAVAQVKTESDALNSTVLKIQQDTQAKYITSLNELQMLKVQKEIAETNQAIAAAKLATVTSEKGITDVLTKPSQSMMPTEIISSLPVIQAPPTPPPPAPALSGGVAEAAAKPAAPVATEYTVQSVAMSDNRWTALLNAGGKIFTVTVGQILSIDGSVVVSIDRDGVVLSKDGKEKKLIISSAM